MFDFIRNIPNDLHPIFSNFPIVLFVLGFSLTYLGRIWPQYHETSWPLFALGVLSAIPSTITGLIAHFPYETTELHEVIELHNC